MSKGKLLQEVRFATHEQLMLAAVRALIESHPSPASFRESWAHMLGQLYRDNVTAYAHDPEFFAVVQEEHRRQQENWETFFPDAPSAKQKPDSPRSGP